jgi:hypothetical protein
MPHFPQKLPSTNNDSSETLKESDLERNERLILELMRGARQLLYAYQPSGSGEMQAVELDNLYDKVKLLKVSDTDKLLNGQLAVMKAHDRLPPPRRHDADSLRAAQADVVDHFLHRSRVDRALKPLTDTGEIFFRLKQKTIGKLQKPQK